MYTRKVVKDPESDDLILDLGDDLCRAAGWKVGDRLEWIDNQDGSWTLRKITWMSRWLNFARHLEKLISRPKT
jgi:hypothetical protein